MKSRRPALDLRLAPLALGTWAGAWLVLSAPRTIALAAFLMASLLAALSHARRSGRHRDSERSVLAVFIAVGLGLGILTSGVHVATRGTIIAEAAKRGTDNLVVSIEAIARTDPVAITGPEWAGDRRRFIADATRVCLKGQCRASREVVTILGPTSDISAGSRITASGRLRAARPGEESAALLSASKLAESSPPRGLGALTARIRSDFRAVADELSPQGAGLVPGISIGDRSRLPASLDDAMKAASLTHLTAVSGAHVAVILATVLLLTAALPRWAGIAAGAATLIGMFLLVGPMPSIKRATVMGLVVLLARLRGRAPTGLPALSVAVIAVVSIWPHSARSYGFALSVTATAGLMLLTPIMTRVLARFFSQRLARALAVPLAAQLACTPIIALMISEVQTYGIFANLIATPAFIPALLTAMPAALLAPVFPRAASVLAHVSSGLTWWLARVAQFFAELPVARYGLPEGIGGVAIAIGGCLVVLGTVIAADRWLSTRPRKRQASRRRMRAALAIAMAAVICGVVTYRWASGGVREWDMWQCDVGQGSAFLIRAGPTSALLVDAGSPGAGVERCLSQAGISNLPIVFLSHPHSDHVGGLHDVLVGVDVGQIIIGPSRHPSANTEQTSQLAASADIDITDAVREGRHLTGSSGQATWQIWGPTRAVADSWDHDAGANDLSLVVYAESGGIRALILGDLELEGQAELYRRLSAVCSVPRCPEIDVLVMAHHGSGRQLPELAHQLAAPVVVISVGADNDYGHPTASAIELYEASGGTIFRTDRDGALTFHATPDGVAVTRRGGS